MPRLQVRISLFVSLAPKLTKRLAAFALLSVLLVYPLCSFAQDTGTGTPAFDAFSHAGGGIDTINLGNLNVHMDIPLRSLGAYGPKASASLTADSLVTLVNLQLTPPLGFGVTFSSIANADVTHRRTGTSCADYDVSATGLFDGRNTFHPTATVDLAGCNVAFRTSGPGADGWAIGGKVDATGLATWYSISPNGDVYQNSSGTVTDPHGNTVTYNGTLTDALGKTVISQTGFGNPATYTYPGPPSTTPTYTLTYTTKNVQEIFGCTHDQITGFGYSLLTSMTFPDQSTMTFTYEPVYNDASKTTGRIASVKLRTGATISYSYAAYGTNGVNCVDGSTAGFTKTTPDGIWTFTHTAPSGTTNLSWTQVTAPSGDYTLYKLSGMYPIEEIAYNAAAVPFNWNYICYNGNVGPSACLTPPSTPTMPITERDVYSYVSGIANPSLQVFLYDTHSRPTDVKTYDFGGVRGGPNFATERTFAYGSWTGSTCAAQNETVQGVAVPITGLICYNTVWTPGSPSAIIVSDMTRTYYPNTADVSTESHLIGGVWRNATFNYDSLGRVLNTTGPNGEYSTVTYGNCTGNLLPSVSTSKASSSLTLTQTIDSMDCTGELPLHSLDANNNGTTIDYTGDPFWRATSVTDAAGTTTAFSYGFTTSDSRTLVTASSVKESLTTLDSMGRVHIQQQRTGPNSTNYNSVETDYDSNGRVSRVTTPYVAAAGVTNGTIASTTYVYDGINRPVSITSPIGVVKSFTYTASGSARDTLVGLNSGPNGEHKQTQYEFNGLGQVTSVCEITSMAGSYSCGQSNPANLNGFSTIYSYSGPGNLLSIVQNSGGTTSQTRSFTYENSNTGRILTVTTPEAGTVHATYDSDGTCGTFIGAIVKTADNGGGTTCLHYDLLGRVISKTYSGLNSANTPSKTFTYDSTANSNITCPTGSNQLGRLAEVSTGAAGIYGGTDEGFCYDIVGNTTDYFQNDGNAWTHSVETYFPTGIPKTLAVATQPTITYGLDAMARITSAGASSGQNPLTSVGYNAAGLPTSVNLGSGDSSTYSWKQGVGPMSTATFNVGSGSATNTLTWHANGSLTKLVITDTLNTADAQTCTYSYDDLRRLLTDNCGSTVWNQTFSYDPFGNVTKTGNPGLSWAPGYQTNNRYLLSSSIAYDANGRLTKDPFDTVLGWDIEGNLINQSSTSIAYDGFGRSAGSVIGGVWTNYFFAPDGGLMGTVTNSGTIQKMFVPLPMSTAVYSGGTLQQYRRTDWQGSVRVASTPSKTLFSDTAYGAFGEPYAPKGTTNNQYAGLNSDISSGTEQVSLSRRYHPTQGRWISPDPAGAGSNLYAYVGNSPLNAVDPSGLLTSDCVGCENDFFLQQLGAWNQSIDFSFNSWVDWNSQHTLDDQGNSLYSQLPGKSNPVQQALIDYADDVDLSSAPNGIEGYTPDNHGLPTVSKSYPLTTACAATAGRVMGAVEGNFARFGNYSRWGGLESVTFSPPVDMGPGSTIPISVRVFGFTQNLSVTVQSMNSQSMTFTTNPGHLLYPASITFAASPASPGSINFNINLEGTVTSPLKFYGGGSSFEDAQWHHFLGQVGGFCKAGH